MIVVNHRIINENITQPDPNRQALVGADTLEGVHYTYGNELPKKITLATVCAVICSIFSSYPDLYHCTDTKAQKGMRHLARVHNETVLFWCSGSTMHTCMLS